MAVTVVAILKVSVTVLSSAEVTGPDDVIQ